MPTSQKARSVSTDRAALGAKRSRQIWSYFTPARARADCNSRSRASLIAFDVTPTETRARPTSSVAGSTKAVRRCSTSTSMARQSQRAQRVAQRGELGLRNLDQHGADLQNVLRVNHPVEPGAAHRFHGSLTRISAAIAASRILPSPTLSTTATTAATVTTIGFGHHAGDQMHAMASSDRAPNASRLCCPAMVVA